MKTELDADSKVHENAAWYMRSLEERVSLRKMENFTAFFNFWCPIEVTRTAGIKQVYILVDCNALKYTYCTIQYIVFVEVKLWIEFSWVITHAMWKMKVACLSDTLVDTYMMMILKLIFTAL